MSILKRARDRLPQEYLANGGIVRPSYRQDGGILSRYDRTPTQHPTGYSYDTIKYRQHPWDLGNFVTSPGGTPAPYTPYTPPASVPAEETTVSDSDDQYEVEFVTGPPVETVTTDAAGNEAPYLGEDEYDLEGDDNFLTEEETAENAAIVDDFLSDVDLDEELSADLVDGYDPYNDILGDDPAVVEALLNEGVGDELDGDPETDETADRADIALDNIYNNAQQIYGEATGNEVTSLVTGDTSQTALDLGLPADATAEEIIAEEEKQTAEKIAQGWTFNVETGQLEPPAGHDLTPEEKLDAGWTFNVQTGDLDPPVEEEETILSDTGSYDEAPVIAEETIVEDPITDTGSYDEAPVIAEAPVVETELEWSTRTDGLEQAYGPDGWVYRFEGQEFDNASDAHIAKKYSQLTAEEQADVEKYSIPITSTTNLANVRNKIADLKAEEEVFSQPVEVAETTPAEGILANTGGYDEAPVTTTPAQEETTSETAANQGSEEAIVTDATSDLITQREGYSSTAYEDPPGSGKWSIGHGTQTYADGTPVKEGDTITEEEAAELRDHHIGVAAEAALNNIDNFNELSPELQAALTSHAYQLGEAGQAGFEKMIAAIEAGDWETAIKEAENSLWAQQTPKRLADLKAALQAEQDSQEITTQIESNVGSGEVDTIDGKYYYDGKEYNSLTDAQTAEDIAEENIRDQSFSDHWLYDGVQSKTGYNDAGVKTSIYQVGGEEYTDLNEARDAAEDIQNVKDIQANVGSGEVDSIAGSYYYNGEAYDSWTDAWTAEDIAEENIRDALFEDSDHLDHGQAKTGYNDAGEKVTIYQVGGEEYDNFSDALDADYDIRNVKKIQANAGADEIDFIAGNYYYDGKKYDNFSGAYTAKSGGYDDAPIAEASTQEKIQANVGSGDIESIGGNYYYDGKKYNSQEDAESAEGIVENNINDAEWELYSTSSNQNINERRGYDDQGREFSQYEVNGVIFEDYGDSLDYANYVFIGDRSYAAGTDWGSVITGYTDSEGNAVSATTSNGEPKFIDVKTGKGLVGRPSDEAIQAALVSSPNTQVQSTYTGPSHGYDHIPSGGGGGNNSDPNQVQFTDGSGGTPVGTTGGPGPHSNQGGIIRRQGGGIINYQQPQQYQSPYRGILMNKLNRRKR